MSSCRTAEREDREGKPSSRYAQCAIRQPLAASRSAALARRLAETSLLSAHRDERSAEASGRSEGSAARSGDFVFCARHVVFCDGDFALFHDSFVFSAR